jgi:hypothetical protein
VNAGAVIALFLRLAADPAVKDDGDAVIFPAVVSGQLGDQGLAPRFETLPFKALEIDRLPDQIIAVN